jgi:hypothetical protein
MREWTIVFALVAASIAPGHAWGQDAQPARQCTEMLACRTAEVNLQNYWSIPLTLQGVSSCAQFCSATYWLSHTRTGEVLLQFGHGGALGPPLLAWGMINDGTPQASLRVRTVVWVSVPNPQFLGDGWYEDTVYTWDASRERLVPGATRRFDFEEYLNRALVRMLEDEGLQVIFTRWV